MPWRTIHRKVSGRWRRAPGECLIVVGAARTLALGRRRQHYRQFGALPQTRVDDVDPRCNIEPVSKTLNTLSVVPPTGGQFCPPLGRRGCPLDTGGLGPTVPLQG